VCRTPLDQLKKPITAAAFVTWAQMLFKRIGPYPAGYLTDTPKQGTRLLPCKCPACGYAARVTRKWLSLSGPPICPHDQIPMAQESGQAGSSPEISARHVMR
jgi:hypothetical protein